MYSQDASGVDGTHEEFFYGLFYHTGIQCTWRKSRLTVSEQSTMTLKNKPNRNGTGVSDIWRSAVDSRATEGETHFTDPLLRRLSGVSAT